ncbi:hypothetical protein DLP3_126 [Stenotrophomonas phage vB_SmaS_DLP_3]|nr:hypothetical protein DLP3_126 [Stenotrophomonas phage vB_SmaS_DLP_3]
MSVVTWGHGRSWIVRDTGPDGKLTRCSEWFTTKEQADGVKEQWQKQNKLTLPVEKKDD